MQTYGIVGYPCKHSLSPLICNAAFQALEIPAKFEIFETRDLDAFMKRVEKGEIAGGSVTMPYKGDVIPYLKAKSADVREIGACNCFKGLSGFNTDWQGALRALTEECDLKGKKIYLLGTGGAGRAILHGLLRKELDVTIFDRVSIPGVKLLSELDSNFDVLINATSCGFKSDESCVPKKLLSKDKVVMDVVYEPLMTCLIKDAKKAGCKVITGEKMLLYQAVYSFEIWTLQKAPLSVMQDALYLFLKKSAPD